MEMAIFSWGRSEYRQGRVLISSPKGPPKATKRLVVEDAASGENQWAENTFALIESQQFFEREFYIKESPICRHWLAPKPGQIGVVG